jgi:hypothetical protein
MTKLWPYDQKDTHKDDSPQHHGPKFCSWLGVSHGYPQMLGYGCGTFYLKKHLTKSLEFRKAIDILIITYYHTVRRKDGLTLKVRAIDKIHLCLG